MLSMLSVDEMAIYEFAIVLEYLRRNKERLNYNFLIQKINDQFLSASEDNRRMWESLRDLLLKYEEKVSC